MAWHTIQEAQKLTGKSRRTLYRDMSKGRLTWAPEGDNARRLETSELIRVYGALLHWHSLKLRSRHTLTLVLAHKIQP